MKQREANKFSNPSVPFRLTPEESLVCFLCRLLAFPNGHNDDREMIDFNRSKFMRIQFHIRGLNISSRVRNHLRKPLERLQSRIPITNAAVVLEHTWNAAPAVRAFVLLAVPGPDIHAEAREHTLEAVWLKATASLRKQIEHRKARQLARIKSKREQGIFPAPWSRTGVSR